MTALEKIVFVLLAFTTLVRGYNTGPALVKLGVDVAMPSYSTSTTYFRVDHGLGLNLATSTSTLYFTANDAVIRSSTSYLKLQTSAGTNYGYLYSDGSNGMYIQAPAATTSQFQITTGGGFTFKNFAQDVLFVPSTSNYPTMRFTDNSLTNIRLQTLTGVNSGYMTVCYNGYYNAGEVVDVAGKTRVRIGLDIRGTANQFFIDQYTTAGNNGQFLKVDFTVGNYVQFPYGILSNSIITSAATDLSLNPAGSNVNFNSKTLTNIGSVYGSLAVTPITSGGAALQQSILYATDSSTTTLSMNCMASTNNYGACLLGWNGQYGSSATGFVRASTSRRMWMWNTPAAATTLDQFNLQSYDGSTTRTHMQLDTAIGDFPQFPQGISTLASTYAIRTHGWSASESGTLSDTGGASQVPVWTTYDGSITIPDTAITQGMVINLHATIKIVGGSNGLYSITLSLGSGGLGTIQGTNAAATFWAELDAQVIVASVTGGFGSLTAGGYCTMRMTDSRGGNYFNYASLPFSATGVKNFGIVAGFTATSSPAATMNFITAVVQVI